MRWLKILVGTSVLCDWNCAVYRSFPQAFVILIAALTAGFLCIKTSAVIQAFSYWFGAFVSIRMGRRRLFLLMLCAVLDVQFCGLSWGYNFAMLYGSPQPRPATIMRALTLQYPSNSVNDYTPKHKPYNKLWDGAWGPHDALRILVFRRLVISHTVW